MLTTVFFRISICTALFKKSLTHTSGDITKLRSACVCNDTFGVLAEKYGFHEHVQNLPPILLKQLNDFLEVVERGNFTFAVSLKC